MLPVEALTAVEGGLSDRAAPANATTYSPIRAWYALIMFEVVCCLCSVDAGVTTMMVKPLEAAFNLSDVSLAAVTLTPVAIGSGLISYPGGLLGDAYKRTDVIAWAVLLWTLATGLVMVVHSPTALFIVRFVAGVGLCGGIPAMASALCDVFPAKQRGFAFGVWNIGLAIGGGVGISLTATLVALADHIGPVHFGSWLLAPWQLCFAMVTGLSLVVGLLSFTVTEPERLDLLDVGGTSTRASFVAFVAYLRRHGLLWGLYSIAQIVAGIGTIASLAWAPTLAIRHFGALGPGPIRLLGLCTTIGTLIGSFGWGMLCQYFATTKRARVLPFVSAGLALATGLIAMTYPFAPSWLLAAVGLGAMGGVTIGFNVFGFLVVNEAVPNRVRGQLFGGMGLVGIFPGAIIPTATAYLADNTFAHSGGFVPALALVGGIGGAVAVVFFLACVRPYARAVDEVRGAAFRSAS